MKLSVSVNDRTYSLQVPWWLLAAALLTAVLWQPATAWASHQFSDVPSSNIFHDDIDWMADVGVTKGCGGDEFCPADYVTRQQMAAFMRRFANNVATSGGGTSAGVESRLATLESDVATLQSQVASLQTLLAGVTRSDDTLRLTGMNLQLMDGSGDTGGAVNGRGNLIIGYDENLHSDTKTGSHNLVVGQGHTYASYGGILGGWNNATTARNATVVGGTDSTASGWYASITGGIDNTASGNHASIVGGRSNTVSGNYSTITSGLDNKVSAVYGSVVGGRLNSVLALNDGGGDFGTVAGGQENGVLGAVGSIAGGRLNRVWSDGPYGSVSGGYSNEIFCDQCSTVAQYSTIVGGRDNQTEGDYQVAVGGQNNGVAESGAYSVVTGGYNQSVTGDWSVISGGRDDTLTGNFDWQAGDLLELD